MKNIGGWNWKQILIFKSFQFSNKINSRKRKGRANPEGLKPVCLGCLIIFLINTFNKFTSYNLTLRFNILNSKKPNTIHPMREMQAGWKNIAVDRSLQVGWFQVVWKHRLDGMGNSRGLEDGNSPKSNFLIDTEILRFASTKRDGLCKMKIVLINSSFWVIEMSTGWIQD